MSEPGKILRQKRSAVLHQMQLLGIDTADWDRVNAFAGQPWSSRAWSSENLTREALDTLQVKLRAISAANVRINNSN
ncbi:MAG: hypothetical protein ACLUHA_13090 [Bacteroides stercoris]